MKLITTDNELRRLLPNVVTTVKGETPLMDKLAPFLEEAERWLVENFTSEKTFLAIAGYAEDNTTKILATQIVCLEAFRRAVPQLDVVLTPNGFGIVNNSNIAPASKERIDRLLLQLLRNRDHLLSLFIPLLYNASGWVKSTQCAFFEATLFPNISLTRHFDGEPDKWDHYLRLREQLITIEQWLADNFISERLMAVFRHETISDSIPESHRSVIRLLQAVEIRILKSDSSSSAMHMEESTLVSIVDNIRNNEVDFPEWHESTLKEVFNPPIFENKKNSTGYFF